VICHTSPFFRGKFAISRVGADVRRKFDPWIRRGVEKYIKYGRLLKYDFFIYTEFYSLRRALPTKMAI